MHKYENLISAYLRQQKTVSLEGIGHLRLENDTPQFIGDKKAETSVALVEYISEKMGKSQSLVKYDVQSHLDQSKQFINLGKPYVIPGFGGITINKEGKYELDMSETAVAEEEEYLTEQASLSVEKSKKKNGLVALAVLLLLFILSAIGYGIYSVVRSEPQVVETVPEPEPEVVALDTASLTSVPRHDSSATLTDTMISRRPDSLKTALPAPAPTVKPDSSALHSDAVRTYRYVFEQTANLARAEKRTDDLKNWGKPAAFDSVKRKDSTFYRLYFIVKAAPSDTLKIKDSLERYFQKKVSIRNN